jgi:carboxyl-terminal processing protease
MLSTHSRSTSRDRGAACRIAAAVLAVAAMVVVPASLAADISRLGAEEAYEHAQELRRQAEGLARDGAPRTDLDAAAAKLQDALDFLARPDVRELAYGNIFLAARRADVLRDVASVRVQMGDTDAALHALELSMQESWSPAVAKWILDDHHFDAIHDEPRFQAVIATLHATARLWSVPAIATPYRESLPVAERIAGLSLFWEEARHGFVYFDHVPDLEWDRVYLDFLPQVIAAQTTEGYYRVMMQLAPLLRDGHTNIYPPKELQRRFYARPPLRTESIQGHVYVTQVASASLARRVHVGDEVIAIDAIPVERYATDNVAPFVSSSTPQDREVRMYDYQLLRGDAQKPVLLALRGADGVERNESVARRGYDDVHWPPEFGFRMLSGEVAYLALDHFESSEGVKAFEKALPQILGAKGLVLDLRDNGGGSSNYGFEILSYLIPGPLTTAQSRYRSESSLFRAGGSSREGRIQWAPTPGDGNHYRSDHAQHYAGPVALLIGPQTFSAAEDFVVAFDYAKRGLLVGSATAGSTGQPLMLALPGGGTARICVKRDSYPDGREFVGKGIAPDVAVTTTIDAIRRGEDPVLDRAAAELSKRAAIANHG